MFVLSLSELILVFFSAFLLVFLLNHISLKYRMYRWSKRLSKDTKAMENNLNKMKQEIINNVNAGIARAIKCGDIKLKNGEIEMSDLDIIISNIDKYGKS